GRGRSGRRRAVRYRGGPAASFAEAAQVLGVRGEVGRPLEAAYEIAGELEEGGLRSLLRIPVRGGGLAHLARPRLGVIDVPEVARHRLAQEGRLRDAPAGGDGRELVVQGLRELERDDLHEYYLGRKVIPRRGRVKPPFVPRGAAAPPIAPVGSRAQPRGE